MPPVRPSRGTTVPGVKNHLYVPATTGRPMMVRSVSIPTLGGPSCTQPIGSSRVRRRRSESMRAFSAAIVSARAVGSASGLAGAAAALSAAATAGAG
jgi:hypothetical protein